MGELLPREGLRLSDVVKWEEGGQNYYSRDLITSTEDLAIGDIIASTGAKIADAVDVIGVCIAATTSGDEALYIARDAIVADGTLEYNGETVATVNGVLKGLGILVREQQPDSATALANTVES